MGIPIQAPQNPPAPNPPQEVTCLACKKTWQFTPPAAQIMNFREFSQVVWAHQKPERCPHCFQLHVFVIGAIQTSWGMTPVKDEERSQIIQPPPGNLSTIINIR